MDALNRVFATLLTLTLTALLATSAATAFGLRAQAHALLAADACVPSSSVAAVGVAGKPSC